MGPGLTGVAVSVTMSPVQIKAGGSLMVTDTGWGGSTIMVIAFEVVGLLVTQISDEVRSQVTTCPFKGVYE